MQPALIQDTNRRLLLLLLLLLPHLAVNSYHRSSVRHGLISPVAQPLPSADIARMLCVVESIILSPAHQILAMS